MNILIVIKCALVRANQLMIGEILCALARISNSMINRVMLYPVIVGTFYPQNGKNDVSTKLCDESQPINFVLYRKCKLVVDPVFSHV